MTIQSEPVDEYIAGFPADVQPILQSFRSTIHRVVPDSGEKISYKMPTVTMDGEALLYFAGWKQHIGMYPVPRFDGELEAEVAPYRAAKDTVRFPLKSSVPFDLVERVVGELVRRRQA